MTYYEFEGILMKMEFAGMICSKIEARIVFNSLMEFNGLLTFIFIMCK